MSAAVHYPNLISSDSHLREPADLWSKTMSKRFGDRTPRIVKHPDGRAGEYFYNGVGYTKSGEIEKEFAQHFPQFSEAAFNPASRVAFQKAANIKAEVICPTQMANILPGKDVEMIQAAAVVLNDFMIEFCSQDPKRLIGNGVVPTHDVAWAVNEVKRIRRKGIPGVIINMLAPEGCPPYRSKVYDPLWDTISELGMPVTLHIITGRVMDPILYAVTDEEKAAAPGHLLDLFREVETPLANDFIFGGVLDRFEKLQLVCGEFELAWIPNFIWRIDQIQDDFAALLNVDKTKHRPSDYVKHRVYHGLISDPHLPEIVDKISPDNILWGSDFPHIRSIGLDAQDRAKEMFRDFPAAAQEKMVGGTVARLYGI
jgi:predicted TIM-barrel fold metal-dependent hydrolase